MDSIQELLERIFSLLIIIVPIYLYMLIRRIMYNRMRGKTSAGRKERKSSLLGRLLAREKKHLGPLIPDEQVSVEEIEAEPVMEAVPIGEASSAPGTVPVQPVRRLDRFMEYPPGMRAVILHEILEREEYRGL